MWRHLLDASLNAPWGQGDFQSSLNAGQKSYQRVIKGLLEDVHG
jgi:hypothetical protein